MLRLSILKPKATVVEAARHKNHCSTFEPIQTRVRASIFEARARKRLRCGSIIPEGSRYVVSRLLGYIIEG